MAKLQARTWLSRALSSSFSGVSARRANSHKSAARFFGPPCIARVAAESLSPAAVCSLALAVARRSQPVTLPTQRPSRHARYHVSSVSLQPTVVVSPTRRTQPPDTPPTSAQPTAAVNTSVRQSVLCGIFFKYADRISFVCVCLYVFFAASSVINKHRKCSGNIGKYGTELLETNYPISFHRGPYTRLVPFRWQPDGRGNETY